MMMPLIMSSYATNLTFAGAGGAMAANQARMDLADSMTGGESQSDIAFAGAVDRSQEMLAAGSRIQYELGLAMQNRAQEMRKKNLEHQRTLMDQDGVIFGG